MKQLSGMSPVQYRHTGGRIMSHSYLHVTCA